MAACGLIAAGAGELPRFADQAYEAPKPGTYKLPVVKMAADGKVLNSKGEAMQLRDLTKGRISVMSFIYTRCASAKACPYATGVLMQLHRASAEDRELSENLRLISISFDPGGDTPKRMGEYGKLAEANTGGAEWHFLTTRSEKELKPILEGYGQAVDKRANPKDPRGPLNHVLRVYLVDAEGQVRNIYSSGTLDARLVLADVKTLLLEK